MAEGTPPLCPVTGEPAARFVQWVEAGFLARLWKLQFRANARPSFGAVQRFGLWESPTGLHFFDPPTPGDSEFYDGFYSKLLKRKLWREDSRRQEFADAARRVRPGDAVLDVGCGFAPFRLAIPEARYTGLDPHFARHAPAANVRDELLHEHLRDRAGSYDVVCAFQVIEHVRDPVTLFCEMVQAARPGGTAIVSVPQIPSATVRIPNFLMNAPPHHLTWWTREALAALAARAGAEVLSIDSVDWDATDSLIYWIERASPIRCRTEFFRSSLLWHAATVASFVAGTVLHRIGRVPARRDEGSSLMLVARRP